MWNRPSDVIIDRGIAVDGHVIGADILPELLAYGTATVARLGLSDRITFRESDVNHLPFNGDTFDWAWSADCIGYPAGELLLLLQELMRVVKPRGEVIVLGWSSQQLLPGYPLLEARLNATCSGYIPFFKEQSPDLNFMRAGHWFRIGGLEEIKAQTFVGEVQSPLKSDTRTALISLFEMLWGNPQPETSPEDWRQYQQLCKPESPDFILDIPDYYGFFTYSMFRGKVPA